MLHVRVIGSHWSESFLPHCDSKVMKPSRKDGHLLKPCEGVSLFSFPSTGQRATGRRASCVVLSVDVPTRMCIFCKGIVSACGSGICEYEVLL